MKEITQTKDTIDTLERIITLENPEITSLAIGFMQTKSDDKSIPDESVLKIMVDVEDSALNFEFPLDEVAANEWEISDVTDLVREGVVETLMYSDDQFETTEYASDLGYSSPNLPYGMHYASGQEIFDTEYDVEENDFAYGYDYTKTRH